MHTDAGNHDDVDVQVQAEPCHVRFGCGSWDYPDGRFGLVHARCARIPVVHTCAGSH